MSDNLLVLEKHEQLKRTMDSHAIVAITDVRGTIVEVNDLFCAISGYNREELIGNNHRILNSGYHSKEFFQEMYRTISRGEIWKGEIKNRAKDGTLYWVDSTFVPWAGKDGKPEFYVAIRTDITKQKRLQEEADRANKSKSEFLAMMSHEIRTPMNGIIGFTTLLNQTQLSETQKDYVKIIESCGKNLLGLINDILDLSKMEAEKLSIEREDFDICDSVNYVKEVLKAKANEKKIEIFHSIENGVPRYYCGDRQRVQQVLMNLVSNAVKFTEWGGITIRVDVVSLEDKKYLKFQVFDTGVGISEEKIKDLFQPFSQVDSSSTRRFEGTGLGLAISKKIIEMMGGSIGCESRLGKGSEFWFALPLVGVEKNPMQFAKKADPADLQKVKGKKVLIVEDHSENAQFFKEQLQIWGAHCEEAHSVKEGYSKLKTAIHQKEPFDLALVDYFMPVANGFQLASLVRRDPVFESYPVGLLLLKSGGIDDEKDYLQWGFDAVLSKPILQLEILLKEIANILSLKPELIRKEKSEANSTKAFPSESLLNVLVAEDNSINYQLVELFLQPLGANIVWAKNGREACDAVLKNSFDIVLMDCQMPEVDGMIATQQIRVMESNSAGVLANQKKRLPIIAVTAHAFEVDRQKFLNLGMDDVLTKPINQKQLKDTIFKWTSE